MEKTVSAFAEGASQFDLCGNLFWETEGEFDATGCHALLFCLRALVQLIWVLFCHKIQASRKLPLMTDGSF